MPTANERAAIGGNNPPSTEDLLKAKYPDIFDRAKKALAALKRADLKPKTREDCAKLTKLYVDAQNVANDANTVREKEKEEPLKTCTAIDKTFNGGVRDLLGTDPKKPGLAQQARQAADACLLALTRAEQAEAQKLADAARAEADKVAARAKADEEAGRIRAADVKNNQVEALDKEADRHEAAALAPTQQASVNVGAGGVRQSVKGVFVCQAINRPELDLEALRPYLKEDALKAAIDLMLKTTGATSLKGAIVTEKAVGRISR